MENKRKELQILSLGMFALIVLQIIELLQYLQGIAHLDTTTVDPNALIAIPLMNGLAIFSAAVTVIFLGVLAIKGLAESKAPTSARVHIILAFIAAVIFGLRFVSQIGNLFGSTDLFNDLGPVLIAGLFFLDTVSYALTAKAIRVKE